MRFGKVEIGISIAAIFCIVAVLGVAIPNYLNRERRVDVLLTQNSDLKMSLRIIYPAQSDQAPKTGIRSEAWQIYNKNGQTTERYVAASDTLSEDVTIPVKRTVNSAALYDGLKSVHVWNVGDEINACPKNVSRVCYVVNVEQTLGSKHHQRTLLFDDLELRQDQKREYSITLDEHRPVQDQMPSMLVLKARQPRNPDYAAIIGLFRGYGDTTFQHGIETARAAVLAPPVKVGH